MPGENIYDWSTTTIDNGSADSSINWLEGMARADVNNSARSMMAAIAKYRDLTNGSIITSGTADVQSFLSGYSFTSIATIPTGLRTLLKIGLTNTGPATLNMDLLGPSNIKTQTGADINAGALTVGNYAEFRYDGTNWVLLGSSFSTIEAITTTTNILNVTDITTTQTLNVTGNSTLGNLHAKSVYFEGLGISPGTGYSCALRVGFVGDSGEFGLGLRSQQTNTNYILFNNYLDAVAGSITDNSGGSINYNTTCDADLKTAIEDLPPVGNIIDKLRPVKFRWKNLPEVGDQSGFLAQEAYQAVPQAVTPARFGAPWQMDYSKLVPLLVAELKSLRARIAALEAK